MCCYLTQLSYPGDGGLPRVLPIHGVLLEKQENLVVFGVIALWDEADADESGVWKETYVSYCSLLFWRFEAGLVTSVQVGSVIQVFLSRNSYTEGNWTEKQKPTLSSCP